MKDVAGYEGLYAITENGEVWSYQSNKFLKGEINRSGYIYVMLYKGRTRRAYRIHRLVAEAYIPNPKNLPQVNHKDENKTNNNVSNLEWCTNKYNINYGTHNQRMKESKHKSVICIETGKVFQSITEASIETGILKQSISHCCKGRYHTAGGYHWAWKGE